MNRLRVVSRAPLLAVTQIPLDSKIQFGADVIGIVIPLIRDKDPQNPGPTPEQPSS